MSNEVTTDTTVTHENGNAAPVETAAAVDKGKGKAAEPVDEDMEDDDDDEEEEEDDDDDGDDLVEEEPLDTTAILSAPRRRAPVDYSSKEALEKAGLAAEPEAAADEEADEYMGNAEEK